MSRDLAVQLRSDAAAVLIVSKGSPFAKQISSRMLAAADIVTRTADNAAVESALHRLLKAAGGLSEDIPPEWRGEFKAAEQEAFDVLDKIHARRR